MAIAPKINFDEYVASGLDAAAVAKIKAEYDAALAAPVDTGTEWQSFAKFAEEFKAAAAPLIASKQERKEKLLKVKAKLQEDFLTSGNWTVHDWERSYPGLIHDAYQRSQMDHVIPMEKYTHPLDSIDLAEVTRKLKSGEIPTELLSVDPEVREYCFGTIQSPLLDDQAPIDWSTWQPTLPGTQEAEDAWFAEQGHLWAKAV